VRLLRFALRVSVDAFKRFVADDGWAIASHIALSGLMALFPFLLVVTALAGFFGSRGLADEAARILLEAWPESVAAPIAAQIHLVLSNARGDLLTVGIVLAVYFSSSGVESLRIGLNRAYGVIDWRPWWLLRLESIGYVVVGAVSLLAFAFLVVLAPLLREALLHYLPGLEPFENVITVVRLVVAATVLVAALIIAHLWLPAGHRSAADIAPGIIATLVLWLVGGSLFGRYLAEFAFTYSAYYAGLASAMTALVFLYLCATIFVYGGELNAMIRSRAREAKTAGKKGPC
jgi:membrane protein